MKAEFRKMLPTGIIPGLHAQSGHHHSRLCKDGYPVDPGCNKRRIMDLHRPQWYPLTVPRRVTVEEWQATR